MIWFGFADKIHVMSWWIRIQQNDTDPIRNTVFLYAVLSLFFPFWMLSFYWDFLSLQFSFKMVFCPISLQYSFSSLQGRQRLPFDWKSWIEYPHLLRIVVSPWLSPLHCSYHPNHASSWHFSIQLYPSILSHSSSDFFHGWILNYITWNKIKFI